MLTMLIFTKVYIFVYCRHHKLQNTLQKYSKYEKYLTSVLDRLPEGKALYGIDFNQIRFRVTYLNRESLISWVVKSGTELRTCCQLTKTDTSVCQFSGNKAEFKDNDQT